MSPRLTESERQRILAEYERQRLEHGIAWGECFCGCGEAAPIAPFGLRRYGQVKDKPMRYIPGHQRRLNPGPEYIKEDQGHDTPCWIWQRYISPAGYGTKDIGDGRGQRPAHRVYYEYKYGPVQDKMDMDHLCRVRACVNPDHVEPVPHAENARRGSWTILTKEQAQRIREQYASGNYTLKELGQLYGVHLSTIGKITTGVNWNAS